MELAKIYAKAMMVSAVEYCRAHNIAINAEHLSQCLKAHKETINGAINDAKAALDAHMDGIANATFIASAKCAGISAAKMYQLEK